MMGFGYEPVAINAMYRHRKEWIKIHIPANLPPPLLHNDGRIRIIAVSSSDEDNRLARASLIRPSMLIGSDAEHPQQAIGEEGQQ